MCTVAGTILGHGKLCSADCAGNVGWAWTLLLPRVLTAMPPRMDPVMMLVALGVVVVDTGVPATRVLLILPGLFFILVWFKDFCLRPGSPGHLSCRIIFSLYI